MPKIPWYIKLKQLLFAATLITTWPDGTTQRTAAVDNKICIDAATYDLTHGAIAARCITDLDPITAGFKPGWDVIKNFNDK